GRWGGARASASTKVSAARSIGTATSAPPAGCEAASARPRSFDALQPDLPEIREDAARAEHAAIAVAGLAGGAVQDDGGGLEAHHLAGLLFDDLVHPRQHGVLAAAVGDVLGVEVEAAVLVVLVERRQDVAVRLDPDALARLQVERLRGRLLSRRDGPPTPRPGDAAPQR